MCSCRWAHTQWLAACKAKYPPRVCWDLSRAAIHLRAMSFRHHKHAEKVTDVFEVKLQRKWVFRTWLLFAAAYWLPVLSPHLTSLSYLRTQPHTHQWQFRGTVWLCLRHAWLTSIEIHQKGQTNYFYHLCSSAHSIYSNTWGTCLNKGKKTVLNNNVGNYWEENLLKACPLPTNLMIVSSTILD